MRGRGGGTHLPDEETEAQKGACLSPENPSSASGYVCSTLTQFLLWVQLSAGLIGDTSESVCVLENLTVQREGQVRQRVGP